MFRRAFWRELLYIYLLNEIFSYKHRQREIDRLRIRKWQRFNQIEHRQTHRQTLQTVRMRDLENEVRTPPPPHHHPHKEVRVGGGGGGGGGREGVRVADNPESLDNYDSLLVKETRQPPYFCPQFCPQFSPGGSGCVSSHSPNPRSSSSLSSSSKCPSKGTHGGVFVIVAKMYL